MTVFNTFFKIGKKHIGMLITYTIIFMGLALAVAAENKKTNLENFTASMVHVAVFDHENSALSRGLIQYLSETQDIVEVSDELDEIRDAVYKREVEYVVTIPENFSECKTIDAYKLPTSAAARLMDFNIENFIGTYEGYLTCGLEEAEAYSKTIETLKKEAEVAMYDGKSAAVYEDNHYFYVYLPYALISVIILTIGPVLIAFNEGEVKRRTECSKISASKRNIELIAGCGVFAGVVVLVYILSSIVLYRDSMLNVAGALRVLNVIIYTLVSLAVVYLLSQVVKKENMLGMFANVIGLGSSFLCGIFVPRYLLADSVAAIGRFLPAYWYVNAEEAICNFDGAITAELGWGLGVQFLYAVALLVLAVAIGQFRKKA